MTPLTLSMLPSITFQVDGTVANCPRYSYRILLASKRGITGATIEAAGERKKREVTFQSLQTNFTLENLIRLILKQHPLVTASLTKLDSSHLLNVEFDDLTSPSLHKKRPSSRIMMKVTGETLEGRGYLLKLYPQNLQESKAFLEDGKGEKKRVLLDLGELEKASAEDLQYLLMAGLSPSVQIRLEPSQEECLCLSILKPAPSLSSLKNVKDLTQYLDLAKPQDPIIQEVIQKIVDAFTDKERMDAGTIAEMISLFDHLQYSEQVRVFKCVAECFVRNPTADPHLVKMLMKILIVFQRVVYRQQLEEGHVRLLAEFDLGDLIKLLHFLTLHLIPQSHPTSLSSVKYRLKALLALLKILIIKGMQQAKHQVYFNAYEAIRQLDNDQELKNNLEIKFLIKYGKLSFLKKPADPYLIFNRQFYLLRGFAEIADEIKLLEPWYEASSFDKVDDFKKINSSQTPLNLKKWFKGKQWFTSLLALHFYLLNDQTKLFELFHQLKDQFDQGTPAAQKILHSPLFLTGLVHLLKEMLCTSTYHLQDFSHKKIVVLLLQRIYRANQAEAQETIPFRLKLDEERRQLCAMIKNCLLKHRIEAHSEVSAMIENTFPDLTQFSTDISSPDHESDKLFGYVINQFPLFTALRQMVNVLEKDEQLQKNKLDYIFPSVEGGEGCVQPLKETLKNFLNDKHLPVFSLEGDNGMGKTLSMKMLALYLLKNYSSLNYFPFYVHLRHLENPIEEIVEETFKLYNINIKQINELTSRKVIFICDGVDELEPTKISRASKAINLYEVNRFIRKDILKVIFVNQTGLADVKRFRPIGKSIQKMLLKPFSDEQILAYLMRRGQKAFEKLKGSSLWEHMRSPFILHVLVETLPLIMQHQTIDIETLFRNQAQSEIEKQIFDIFACAHAYRSSLKTGNKISPYEFLSYSAKLAKAMQDKNFFSIPMQAMNELEDEEDFFDFMDSPKKERQEQEAGLEDILKDYFDESQEVLYKECLVLQGNRWSFAEPAYQLHLVQYASTSHEKLKEMLSKMDQRYHLNQII